MYRVAVLGAAIGVLFLSANPSNADGYAAPRYAPVALAPATWTGVYVGGNLGYAWGDTVIQGTANDPFTPPYQAFANANADTSLDPDGFAGGIKGGGNYQIGHIVFGAEVSYDWLDVDDSRQTGLLSPGPGLVPGSFFDKVEIESVHRSRALGRGCRARVHLRDGGLCIG